MARLQQAIGQFLVNLHCRGYKPLMAEISIHLEAGNWEQALPNYEALIERALAFVSTECSLVLADDKFVQQLNAQFRGQDKPTNVLSFPSEEEGYLGDSIVALETLQREAEAQGKALKDHFTHLIIHGCLHLMGYDHEEETEAQEMENKEIELLAKLNIANPYEVR